MSKDKQALRQKYTAIILQNIATFRGASKY